jgi:hypothetical protein
MGARVGMHLQFWSSSQLDDLEPQTKRAGRGSNERTFLPAVSTLLAENYSSTLALITCQLSSLQ